MSQAERALDDTAAMVNPTKPQLDKLKELLQNGDQQAQDAKDSADDAAEEATSASKVRTCCCYSPAVLTNMNRSSL